MLIPLELAIKYLENCSAIIIEDHIIYPLTDENKEGNDGILLFLEWNKENGYQAFLKDSNNTVKIEGSIMTLFNLEGEEKQITLLETKQLEDNYKTSIGEQ